MVDEPEYVDDGNEFGDYSVSRPGMPKWRVPSTDLQRRILSASHRKYWPPKDEGGRELRSFFIGVERSMLSLMTGSQSFYPAEWVEYCVAWYERKCKKKPMPLKALCTFLMDTDALNQFVKKWQHEHKYDQDYGRELHVHERGTDSV
jgi:hypothetical protein